MNNQTTNKPYHPSLFETTESHTPAEQRTMTMLREQRGQRLTKAEVEDLVSPGKYKLTIDDNKISKSNTNQMFKNLYGETLLTYLFFSDRNVETVQELIRMLVYRETKYVIDKQSYTELLIIMRSIFLEYSSHPPIITDAMSVNEKNRLQKMYTEEVRRLNDIILNNVVPKVISQMQQYLDYLRDAGEQPYYMERAENKSIKGQKDYRSITQVLIGGDL